MRPRIFVTTGREGASSARIIKGMKKKKMLQRCMYDCHTQHPYPFPRIFNFYLSVQYSLSGRNLSTDYFFSVQ